uniref:Peroxisomal biogenesis factor 3 n=1 Tax=Hydra vulgaris TaxID=6087 RepID=T2MFJ3_HYDVU
MFSSIYDFYKRHRKKIIFTGIFVGSTYAITKLVSWKFNEWAELKVKEMEQEAKKQYLFESNQRTCTATFLSFLPDVQEVITSKTNLDQFLEILKLNPANKIEIWENIKILSMAQMIASVLSNILLLVLLKVQLNIIGGYMFVTMMYDKEMDVSDIQKRYLSNVKVFIEQRLPLLVDDVILSVKEIIGNVSLKEKISFLKLQSLTENVIEKLKSNHLKKSVNFSHPFSWYLINNETSNTEERYRRLMFQTNETLSGDSCALVLEDCISSGLQSILNNLKDVFFGYEEDPEAITSIESCAHTSFFKEIELPMAKITPLLNQQLHQIFKSGQNNFLDSVFSQSSLHDFSSNIFDAFSRVYN